MEKDVEVREHSALQHDMSLYFHSVDNEQLICYSKCKEDLSNVILIVVKLDYRYKQSGWTALYLERLGINPDQSYWVNDLLSDAWYRWQGLRNYVELNPGIAPAQILRVRHKARTERDFDYFM